MVSSTRPPSGAAQHEALAGRRADRGVAGAVRCAHRQVVRLPAVEANVVQRRQRAADVGIRRAVKATAENGAAWQPSASCPHISILAAPVKPDQVPERPSATVPAAAKSEVDGADGGRLGTHLHEGGRRVSRGGTEAGGGAWSHRNGMGTDFIEVSPVKVARTDRPPVFFFGRGICSVARHKVLGAIEGKSPRRTHLGAGGAPRRHRRVFDTPGGRKQLEGAGLRRRAHDGDLSYDRRSGDGGAAECA